MAPPTVTPQQRDKAPAGSWLPPFRSGSAVTRVVLALVATTIILGSAAFAITALRDRKVALKQAERSLAEVVMLMEEQTRAALETDAVILSRVEAMVTTIGIDGLRGRKDYADHLRWIMADAPAIQSLLVFDPSGNIIQASKDLPAGDSGNRSDREYFSAVKPPAPRQDFISPLVQGRISNQFLFAVSRRVDDSSGHFIGVVQSTTNANHFISFFQRLDCDPTAVFGIFKPDGTIVIRHPLPVSDQERDAYRHARFTQLLPNQPNGSYTVPGLRDGIERLFAYRTMPERGLVLTAGLSTESILADWRRRTWHEAGLALGALLVELAMAAAALRAAARADNAHMEVMQAHRSKAIFFASASHDLRQPYQAMRLFWAVVDGRAEMLEDPRLNLAVRKLGQAMDAGEELLNALLDVATLEAGSVIPRPADIAVNDIMGTERDSFGKLAESRGLRLTAVPSSLVVHSDQILLRRILRNLIVNAIKYTSTGGVVVGCRRRGPQVLLQVWDTGCGIPADKLDEIFEDFYQIDNSARLRTEGLGLGLSVVSRTARLLGHKVQVQSRLGRGSVFTVVLPAA